MDFTILEVKGKKIFEKLPLIKKSLKRVYHLSNYALSKEKFVFKGRMDRVSPDDGFEYFYGYYDKSPWDATDRYIIALKARETFRSVAPKESAEVVLIDTAEGNKVIPIGKTDSWNVQQGCMAQWMGPDFKTRIIYNDFREGAYCGVIFNVLEKREEKVLSRPIYDISRDGKYALSLDFSRLHRMRPGYGYSNLEEETKQDKCPDRTCIWKIEVEKDEITELLKYTDLADFEPSESMKGAEHKVNHLIISPTGERFMYLHRWIKDGRKNSRLVTVQMDGSQMYNLSDDVFVSHSYWKDENHILSFLRKKDHGDHYYLLTDKSQEYKMFWPKLSTDGHCSYSPDGKSIITDTYPNRKRIASVYLCREDEYQGNYEGIAQVFAPFKYDNETRCDLHPRWNRKGNKVCIDSTQEGKRALYLLPILNREEGILDQGLKLYASVIIPCYNGVSTIGKTLRSLEQQSYRNFEVIIIDDGSEDSIEEFIEEFKSKTKLSITFAQQENRGVSSARNHGMDLAKGKYLFFLDADDVYHPLFLEKMIYVSDHDDVDSALAFSTREVDKVLQGEGATEIPPEKMEIQDYMEFFMYEKGRIHFAGMIYKKSILDEHSICFPRDTKYGEDLEFAWRYLANCKSGVVVKDYLYGYYDNPSGTMRAVRWEKTDSVEAMLRVEDYLKDIEHPFQQEFCDYMLPRAVWTTAKTFAAGKRKDYYDQFIKEYEVRRYMAKLRKSARHRLLKISSLIYLANESLYYRAIGVVYKNR